jgi:hypothetical protein
MSKLGNIIKGWTSEESEMSKERVQNCFNCSELNNSDFAKTLKKIMKKDACGICGCIVEEKAKVSEEECPLKIWKMEINNNMKIALSLDSPNYAELSLKDNDFIIDFKEVSSSEDKIKFDLSLRNNTNAILSDLKLVPTCGCTLVSKIDKTLLEGKKTSFSFEYKINSKVKNVDKTILIIFKNEKNEEIINKIKLIGKIK